jgi:DNA/RNA endonuclease G (NUC1)
MKRSQRCWPCMHLACTSHAPRKRSLATPTARPLLLAVPILRDQSLFYEDPGADARFRSKLSDFQDSGYDRGHMVRVRACRLVGGMAET